MWLVWGRVSPAVPVRGLAGRERFLSGKTGQDADTTDIQRETWMVSRLRSA